VRPRLGALPESKQCGSCGWYSLNAATYLALANFLNQKKEKNSPQVGYSVFYFWFVFPHVSQQIFS
jgi:hypothetical protein